MATRSRHVAGLLVVAALGVPGCLTGLESPRPDLAALSGGGQAPFGNAQARPVALTLPMEVLFVRRGEDRGAEVESLWGDVDEQAIDPAVRRRLAANGLRAGILRGGLPEPLVADAEPPLSSADDPAPASPAADANPPVVRRVLRLLPGRESEVVGLKAAPNLVVMEADDDGLHGASYADALPHFSLRAWPAADGRVRVELVPVIRHGPVERSWVGEDGAFKVETGQRRRLLETLRWEAMVPPDAMLVVGASGDAGTTVGDALFRPHVGGGREWRLLAMRPLDPAVDPMFRDGDEGNAALAARGMSEPGPTAP